MSQNFNWVDATSRLYIRNEFKELAAHVEDCVAKRKAHAIVRPERFECETGSSTILIERRDTVLEHEVRFTLRENDIEVRNSSNEDVNLLTILPADKKMRLRYQINGEGSYKRWQVAQRALEHLFFRGRP